MLDKKKTVPRPLSNNTPKMPWKKNEKMKKEKQMSKLFVRSDKYSSNTVLLCSTRLLLLLLWISHALNRSLKLAISTAKKARGREGGACHHLVHTFPTMYEAIDVGTLYVSRGLVELSQSVEGVFRHVHSIVL